MSNPSAQPGSANRLDKSTGRLCEEVKTAEQAYEVLKFWQYKTDESFSNSEDYWSSLLESLTRCGGDCEDYAFASAKLLENDGYSRKLIYLEEKETILTKLFPKSRRAHLAHLLEKEGNFGIHDLGFLIVPEYDSIEKLMENWELTRMDFSEGNYSIWTLPQRYDYGNSQGDMKPWLDRLIGKTPLKQIPH